MRSALVTIATLTALVLANHPFVGEHANATSITREDGGISMKMTKKKVSESVNKYNTMVDQTSMADGPEMSVTEMMMEHVLGKSVDKQTFEAKTEALLAEKEKQRARNGKKKLGEGHVGTILKTDDGFMWTGTIYMGKFSPVDVVFDTGSDWLVVESHLCDSCEGNTYDTSQSTVIGTEISQRWYGSARLAGAEHQDVICILLSTCVENFSYFAIYDQIGLGEPIDGILGLARPNPFYWSAYHGSDPQKIGPMYLLKMFDQGLINQRTVSFYFDQTSTSYVDFGQPQETAMRNKNDVKTFEMIEDDFFWSIYNQAVGIGSTTSSDVYGYADAGNLFAETLNNNSVYSIFDTGLSAIMLSGAYHKALIHKIFKYMGASSYKINSGYVLTECYTNFPPIYFMFDNQWLKLDPEDYVIDASNAEDGSVCLLLLVGLDGPYNIFGTPLLKGYYSIHEMDSQGNAKLGIVPNNISTKPIPYKGGIPIQNLDFSKRGAMSGKGSETGWALVYALEIVILIGFILIFTFLLLPKMKDKWQYEEGGYNKGLVVICSIAYFFGVGIFELWVLEPLFKKVIIRASFTAHPDTTPQNIGRAVYFSTAIALYYIVYQSYLRKTKLSQKKQVKNATPEELQKLVNLLEQVQKTKEANEMN